MAHLGRDLKYALRGLARAPVFTAVALGSIALGIGANTAIFALVDEVLLRMMPVKDPERLLLFTGPRDHYGSNSGGNMLSFPMYEDFRDNFVDHGDEPALPRVSLPLATGTPPKPLFTGIMCRRTTALNIGIDGQTERVPGELVSGTYFEVLGVGAALGRLITRDDDRVRGGSDSMVAVLSFDYWRNRFGADPTIVGRRIMINNYPFTVIGVSQAGFDGVDIGYVPSVRVPVMMKAQMTPNWDDMDERRSRWVNVFARMKPGVTIEQVKAALQPFFHGLLEQEVRMPAFRNASSYAREQFLKGQIDLLPAAQGRSPIRQQLSQPLWVLMAIVAGVLLIACANVASLLIARATARSKEIAVRLALGASRGRIVGQLLVESVLLSTIGGALGLFVASWTTKFLLRFLPTTDTPHVISGAIAFRVLAFNFGVSVITGVLFGLVPALRSTKPNLAPTLKDQIGSVVGGGVGFRKGLVVGQVTLSVLLLVGAGLFIRSLHNLQELDLGLRTENLIAFNVSPTLSGYTPVRSKLFNNQLSARIAALPGITNVAFANIGLLEGNEWDSSITVEGYAARPGENMNPYCNAVSPGYFRTMGIPLVAGRDFDQRDAIYEPPDPARLAARSDRFTPPPYRVAIVNESYAKHYFGDRPALGRHIGFGIDPGTKTPIEIIGIVKDAKYTGVRDEIPRQAFFPFLENDFAGGAVMYVRTSQPPSAAFGSIRQALRDVDANVPLYNPRTLEHQIESSLLNERLVATLSTAFGVLATLLAIIGLYGVMAYTVARRTREIGLRMALGAVPTAVVWLVMREVLLLVGAGVTIGLIAALALSRLVRSQLYGITPHDPITIVAAALALAAVAMLAGYVPARRATRVNPVLALRYE
jgi:predicted permease